MDGKKPNGYWNNYENCFNAAKECKNRCELKRKHIGAYVVARKNKWLDDYTWFVKNSRPLGFWNYEHCYDAAMTCTSRKEFIEKYSGAYDSAIKNGWLEDYTWFIRFSKPRGYWNYDACYELAKECSCSSEMEKKSGAAITAARKNGWIKDYCWFVRGARLHLV